MTTTRTFKLAHRARLAVAAASLGLIATLAPGLGGPAGAWGADTYPTCNTLGLSTEYLSYDYAETRNRAGSCDTVGVRFRSWGFYSPWDISSNPVVTLTDTSGLFGGADHIACSGCSIFST